MSAPLLNITFCGTNVEGTREKSASIRAIKKFENHLILSGVGSSDAYDSENNIHYPTPGTFIVDDHLNRQIRSPWVNQHFSLAQRTAGFFLGMGEKSNLQFALQQIENKMKQLPLSNEAITVNITGYSRGGASAVNFANMLYQKYGNRIRVNLLITDPNAGLGRQYFQFKKRIPHNVDNFYVVFNRGESIPFFKALTIPFYFFMNPKTNITALYMDGDHVSQDLHMDVEEKVSPAQLNQQLMELFFDSFGAKRIHKEDSPMINFQKSLFIERGFVSYRSKENMLDKAIRSIKSLKQYDTPKHVEENAYLVRFNEEIQSLNQRILFELSYYFAHLLSELDQPHETEEEQQKAALLLQATNNLIKALTPSSKKTMEQKMEVLEQFNRCAHQNDYNKMIVEIIAQIVGLVSGLFVASVMALGGCIVGLTRLDTFCLAAIPYTFMGAFYGFREGYEWGKYQVYGHQNANKIEKRVHTLFKEEQKTQIERDIKDTLNSFVVRLP